MKGEDQKVEKWKAGLRAHVYLLDTRGVFCAHCLHLSLRAFLSSRGATYFDPSVTPPEGSNTRCLIMKLLWNQLLELQGLATIVAPRSLFYMLQGNDPSKA